MRASRAWETLLDVFEGDPALFKELPFKACYVGPEAAARLVEYVTSLGVKTCLVVSDANTRQAAGEALLSALSGAGLGVTEHTLGPDPVDATDALGDDVATRADGVESIIAVGSGSICDLAKHAGDKRGLPVILYPTAASMNGYTSGIVALKVRGLKRTIPCAPARAIFADPAISAKAPAPMVAAGIADFLSKCSSSTDWRAAHILRGAPYTDKPRRFFEGTQDRVLVAAPLVADGAEEAHAIVLKALMLSGFSMVVAGSSAPASGGEHLISHYIDMKSALYGTPHDLHGAQVGVATIGCLRLWERILAIHHNELDIEGLVRSQPKEQEIQQWITDDWGPVADEVRAQWAEKRLNRARLMAELERLKKIRSILVEECEKDLLPAATVENAIRAAGGPTDAEGLNAPREEFALARKRARYIRNRFTVLDLAQELCLI